MSDLIKILKLRKMLGQTELTKSKKETLPSEPAPKPYQTYTHNQLKNSKALVSVDQPGFGAFSSDYNNDSNPSTKFVTC